MVGRWERGEVEPSLETLRSMIAACGLELGSSLRRSDDEQLATIRLALELTPEQRLDQLVAWVDFVGGGAKIVSEERRFEPRALLAALEEAEAL